MNSTTTKITYCSMLAAIAVLLTYLVHFPILPMAEFLEYDAGDVPIFIGAIMLGPWWGLLLTLVTSVLQGLLVSAQSGIIGIMMHFFATGSFVLCAGLISSCYKKTEHFRVIAAFVCGIVTWVLVMIPLNLIFTPIFLSNDLLSAIAYNVQAMFKAMTAIPTGFSALITGAACAIMFAATFLLIVKLLMQKRKMTKSQKTDKNAGPSPLTAVIIGIVVGAFYTILVLLLMSLIFSDVVFPDGMNFVYDMMFTVLVPFNAIKASLNAAVACLVYMAISKSMKVGTTRKGKKKED